MGIVDGLSVGIFVGVLLEIFEDGASLIMPLSHASSKFGHCNSMSTMMLGLITSPRSRHGYQNPSTLTNKADRVSSLERAHSKR